MSNNNVYKGYKAKISYSEDDNIFWGKILGITDLVTFEADNVNDLINEFHIAVDDYLELCNEIGKAPDKEFKGQFNVRIPPQLHRTISIKADMKGISLNKLVENALEEYVKESKINVTIPMISNSKTGDINQKLWDDSPQFLMNTILEHEINWVRR